jgi:aspartate dehydrogenase
MARVGKVKIGILGCGAIGSRMAKSIQKGLSAHCRLTAIFDIDIEKTKKLAKHLHRKGIVKRTITDLIKNCDCMIEAVSAQNTRTLIRQALEAKKSVLSMSVGKLLNASDLFALAHRNRCHLLLPAGAIAGIDAIKAASLAGIDTITLTTRKPPSGFLGNPYVAQKKINLSKIRRETVLFAGSVANAVKNFPQNINVAATLALASQCQHKLRVRITTSPLFTTNSHEIELEGKFGRIKTRTDNIACPDNPKTSYLAVLSGLQTLKQHCSGVFVGT